MRLKSFKLNDRLYKKSQEKKHWNSGLNYTDDLHKCCKFEAFRLMVLVQIYFTKFVLLSQACQLS